MKKIFNIIIIMMTIFMVTGCNSNKPADKTDTTNNTKTNAKVNTKTTDSVLKDIKDVDKNRGNVLPLGIESVKLLKSGRVLIKPTDKAIADGEFSIADNAKEIYIFEFGNAGYRSIMFIKNDGTVSAVNASKLIKNKKIEIINNLGKYTNVKSIEQGKDQSGQVINAVLTNGKKYMLDKYIK